MRLLLATHNPGKRREWASLLKELNANTKSPLALLLPEDIGLDIDVKETGETYTENALLKARTLAEASGLPTLADDSGLEVDALEGAPGVRSARYKLGTDEVRYRALLKALEGVREAQRTARFRCVAALVLPDGRAFTTEGVCEGVIAQSPQGHEGFGYDPVFYLPDQDRMMAELSEDEKNQVSHRAHAAQAMRAVLNAIKQS